MDKQPILKAITDINTLEELSSWDLQTLLADFPFFQTAHLLWAKKAMDTDNYEQQEILQKAAIYAGNRAVLYKLMYQKEELHPSSSLDDATLQIDKKDIPLIIANDETDGQETEMISVDHLDLDLIDEELDGQETEVVSVDHLGLTEEGADEKETEVVSINHLDLTEEDADGQETEIVPLENLELPEEEEVSTNVSTKDSIILLDNETEALEEMAILDKLKAEIAEKQKSIELQLKEEREELQSEKLEEVEKELEESFDNFVENTPASTPSIDEKLEDTARSITSALDKSLLKIAHEDVIEVVNKEVKNIPATLETVEKSEAIIEEDNDKFALNHIFETQEDEEEDYLSTEQISEEARKRVQEELTAKLKNLDENIDVPIIESSNTVDLSDMVKKEVRETIQKDIEQLEEAAEEEIWEDEDDGKVNSAIIRASIKEDKQSLKESLENSLDNDDDLFVEEEEDSELAHPENEIESDLIMNLKAKVESYKQKKKTFESWLTGDLEKEEQPKVKLSEEDETEIKKFVDYQSEMNNNEKTQTPSTDNEPLLEGTESMAEVYAQQGYYKRAVKIYEQLSLKYPEKSSYFAVKIVELQKKL